MPNEETNPFQIIWLMIKIIESLMFNQHEAHGISYLIISLNSNSGETQLAQTSTKSTQGKRLLKIQTKIFFKLYWTNTKTWRETHCHDDPIIFSFFFVSSRSILKYILMEFWMEYLRWNPFQIFAQERGIA